jgi:hypothetical protein
MHGRSETDLNENLANKVCDAYWNPPPDPNIYRRQLLNAQKMREKQQAARRVRHEQSRTSSPGGINGLLRGLEHSSHVSNSLHLHQNRMVDRNTMHYGGYQLSSSMQDHGNHEHARLSDDASILSSGPQNYISGPQSYNDTGPTSIIPGSFNELDFAYALQRPGVVPMGESYSSSVDMSIGPSVSGHAPYIIQQHQGIGSYDANLGNMGENSNRQHATVTTSRSFGEGDVRNAAKTDIDQNSYMYASSHDINGVAETGRVSNNPSGAPRTIGQNTSTMSTQSVESQSQLLHSMLPPLPAQKSTGASVASMDSTNGNSDEMASRNQGLAHLGRFGSHDARAFFQQQQVALQQQQMILQQQQAALALQQEQLRAYGMNQAMLGFNSTAANMTSAGMISGGIAPPGTAATAAMSAMTAQHQQQQLQQSHYGVASLSGVGSVGTAGSVAGSTAPSVASLTNGGYCYVTAADGTPILVQLSPAASQLHAQLPNLMPGQMTALQASIPHMQGMQLQGPGMISNLTGIATAGNEGEGSGFVGISPQGTQNLGTTSMMMTYPPSNHPLHDGSRRGNQPNY